MPKRQNNYNEFEKRKNYRSAEGRVAVQEPRNVIVNCNTACRNDSMTLLSISYLGVAVSMEIV